MMIYADIRPLIVTGIVLFLTNFGWNYPLPLKRKLQIPGKRMVMTKKSCQDPLGNKGICMFKYDCIRQKGVTLSTCVDGFLFGACCFLKDDFIQIISDDIQSNQSHLVNYKKQNGTIYNFYQIKSDASLSNSKVNPRPAEETFKTSLNNFSRENSQENSSLMSPTLLNSTESTPSTTVVLPHSLNDFTTVENAINKYIINNITQISSAGFTSFESSTFVTQATAFNEELGVNNKSTSISHIIENGTESNNLNDLFTSLNQTYIYPTSPSKPNDNTMLEEYRNQFLSSSHFDDIDSENSTNGVTSYLNEWKSDKIGNSTIPNSYVFPNLNSTDATVSIYESFIKNISLSTEKNYELNETQSLENYKFPLFQNNIKIQPSVSTVSQMASSLQNSFSSTSEKYSSNSTYTTKSYGIKNLITSDESFITGSTQNTTETPSIQTNSEFEALDLTSITSPVLKDNVKLDEFEDKELFNANTTSSNLAYIEYITTSDKPPKSSNDSIESFNLKSSYSNKKTDGKKTTKADLPTLPWSSNSILPESFQSVISQLIKQEISSPGNFILDDKIYTTPAVDVNTLVEQSVPLESEESAKLDFKSQNISGFPDDEYDESHTIFVSELVQPSNTNLSNPDNFTLVSLYDSSIGMNGNKIDNNNNQSNLVTPNVLIEDSTKNELNVKLTEIPSTDHSNDASDIISDKYYTKEISQSEEDFIHPFQEEKTEVDISTSSLDLLTENSDTHTVIFESNLNSLIDETLESTQTVPYIFLKTPFQDTNNQKENNIPISIFDQSFSEPSTSFSNLQNQSLDSSLYNATDVSTTVTKDATTNRYPTVIQIINNHIGKNLSAMNFSNHMTDTNESYVYTTLDQSEKNGSVEGITIYPIVNNSLETNGSLDEAETCINASTPLSQNVEDIEESQPDYSSTHLFVNTDASNSFNESVDSSQSISYETISSHTDLNSTITHPSTLIDNSTSPFTTIVDNETKDIELHSTYFDEQYLPYTDESSTENIDDSYNLILSEVEHSTGLDIYSYESSSHPTTETSSTHNIISLNNSDESSSDNLIASQITTEGFYDETYSFTNNIIEFFETVSSPAPATFPDMAILTDQESSSESISSKPTNLNSSDISVITTAMETITPSTLTSAATTPKLDFLTYGDTYTNTSSEYSVVYSTRNTTLTSTIASESSGTQDNDIVSVDQLTNLATKTYSTPVPATTTVLKADIHRWNYKKDCGVRLMQPVGRIVGGKNTYFGKWPWQALVKEATWLGLFVKNKCGGVLITSKYVLTAAHCQPGFLASLLVVLGTHDLAETFDNKGSIIRNVKRMVVHRHYNPQTFENDLALLEMEAPVEFLPYVVPICLPHRNEDFTGKMAFVTGWGKLTAGGDVPNILQEVQVPIVSNGECQSMFYQAGHHKSIRSNFVCAGYTSGGQDSCEGDSGGPLMVQREDTRWVLIGTVSHGIGCADPNLPGVYMRMSSYRPWIDSIIYK